MKSKLLYYKSGIDENFNVYGTANYTGTKDFTGYAIKGKATFEQNALILDGTSTTWGTGEYDSVCAWSNTLANSSGEVNAPLTLSGSSTWVKGVTVWFDETDYPDRVTLTVDGTNYLVSPTNGVATFSVGQFRPGVETTTLSFGGLLPGHRVKIRKIALSEVVEFTGANLVSCTCIHECDLNGETLPASSVSAEVVSSNIFANNNRIEAWYDTRMIGTYYLTGAKVNAHTITISGMDAVGIFDSKRVNGVYFNNYSALSHIHTLLQQFSLPFVDDTTGATATNVSGIRPDNKTVREAIKQICFASGYSITTDGTNKVCVKNIAVETPKVISDDLVYQGVRIDESTTYRTVELTQHSFTSVASGTYQIGTSYYNDTTSKVTKTNADTEAYNNSVKTISDMLLITSANADAVATRTLAHIKKTESCVASIVWDGERLGDTLTIDGHTGVVKKITHRLSAIDKAEVVMLL